LPAPPAEAPFDYVIPLADEAACRGLLLISTPSNRARLRGGDREHLILLAGQLAAALRNVSLLQELLGKRILEEEMQLAQNIQLGLLPKEKPKLKGLDLHGLSRPSRLVGGDYYDWLERGDDLYLIIADVAGKGIPAAMLMATVQASLRALAREGMAPGEILSELNDIVYDSSPRDRFVPPPYLTRNGDATVPLQEGGLILGAFPSTEFETYSIPFGEGDRLVCYTDGVSETANARGEQFSDRRLAELLALLQGDPETVISGVIEDLSRFSISGEPEDDCTLLVFIGAAPSQEGAIHAR
jgi:sigma-B regulation protein RsbU (phosphoserine phosphatase)